MALSCRLSHLRVIVSILARLRAPRWPLPASALADPSSSRHLSPHRVDNNHLLLLMIHVFRENEEQPFRVSPGDPKNEQEPHREGMARWAVRPLRMGCRLSRARCVPSGLTSLLRPSDDPMSTGHMEGNLQLLQAFTDCYVYLLRKVPATPTKTLSPHPLPPGPLPRSSSSAACGDEHAQLKGLSVSQDMSLGAPP